MIGFLKCLHLFLFGLLAFNICHVSQFNNVAINAQSEEDVLEDEATVETDAEEKQPVSESDGEQPSALTEQEQAGSEEMPDGLPRPHPSIQSRLLFTDPSALGVVPRASAIVPLEVPCGRPVHVLVAFKHVSGGEGAVKEFTLDGVAGSLRYPSDYSYYIQNFTAARLDRVVESEREASISYAFTPAAQLNGRPYGLTVRVFYHDAEGQTYVQTVMNETVQLVEWEAPGGNRWLDHEAIFMYLVVLSVSALGLLSLYHLWQSYARKGYRSKKSSQHSSGQSTGAHKSQSSSGGASDSGDNGAVQAVMAAARAKGVDVDWIPKEHLIREGNRRSPPRQSPKQRKLRRDKSSQDESE